MTDQDFEILKHMMNGASPPDWAVRLLEDVCARTGLDWKARHVYLQKRRNKNGTDSWQAVLSIDGFRAVGSASPDYLGQEGPLFVTAADGGWTDIPPEGAPYAAKVGIRKRDGLTTWGVAKYRDYYAGMMWDKFPSTMVAKCAEMLAWRKTFPRVFGGLYGDAEMAQSAKVDPKERPVLAEENVPEPAIEPSLRGEFNQRLESAKDLATVIAIGKEIQEAGKAKKIEEMDVMGLHMLYTKMKKQYGG